MLNDKQFLTLQFDSASRSDWRDHNHLPGRCYWDIWCRPYHRCRYRTTVLLSEMSICVSELGVWYDWWAAAPKYSSRLLSDQPFVRPYTRITWNLYTGYIWMFSRANDCSIYYRRHSLCGLELQERRTEGNQCKPQTKKPRKKKLALHLLPALLGLQSSMLHGGLSCCLPLL